MPKIVGHWRHAGGSTPTRRDRSEQVVIDSLEGVAYVGCSVAFPATPRLGVFSASTAQLGSFGAAAHVLVTFGTQIQIGWRQRVLALESLGVPGVFFASLQFSATTPSILVVGTTTTLRQLEP